MDLIQIATPVRERPWVGYALAVAVSLLALWARMHMGPAVAGYPFLTPMIAVMISAFFGGLGPGILATVLGGLFARFFLMMPVHDLTLSFPTGWLTMIGYCVIAAMGIATIQAIFHTISALQTSEAALKQLAGELEARVADRTRALEIEMKERSETEAQLRQLQKIETLGQLTSGIAHDFNNMLAIVIGSLDMGRRRLAVDDREKAEMLIGNAMEGAERAAALTRRLLAFARHHKLDPEAIDANRLISGMLDLLRRTLGEQISIETKLGKRLWLMLADKAQLENAVLNLAVNARDAMADGGTLTLETANETLGESNIEAAAGQYVRLSLVDTGGGMVAEIAERAFEPFFTTKAEGKGTGLGLSQVQSYAVQSGGLVRLLSTPGQGTRVDLLLPRRRGGGANPGQTLDEEPPPPGSAERVILVVEDESQVRYMTVDVLTELGYTVIQAEDGRSALAEIAARPNIDLMFTDVVMPGMSGRKLAERVRANWPEIKILFTTGYARSDVMREGGPEIGGGAFLPKPFTVDQLARKVHDMLVD